MNKSKFNFFPKISPGTKDSPCLNCRNYNACGARIEWVKDTPKPSCYVPFGLVLTFAEEEI